jgi:hypothetical protein
MAKTCGKDSPEQAEDSEDTGGVEVTDSVRDAVNGLLRDGGGTDAVMERYDIDRRQANKLIMKVKGFTHSNE